MVTRHMQYGRRGGERAGGGAGRQEKEVGERIFKKLF